MTDTPTLADYGTKGYDGPQPWDLQALGLKDRADELDPGAPNTITPTVSHNNPILTSGSTHPVVHELGRKLGDLGFPNSVSRGENAFGVVDQTILSAVDAFRGHYGIQEDPSGFGGSTATGRVHAAAHLGPWTIEGILRAHARAQDEQK